MYASNIKLLIEELPSMDDEEISILFGEMDEAITKIEDVEESERVSYFVAMTELQAVVKAEMMKRGFTFVNC